MGLAETVYARSPHLVRDLLVSVMGYRFVRQRYRGNYASLREHYARLSREAPAAQQARQNRMLRELTRLAREKSPFFRELYAGRELPETIEQIQQLPILKKDAMRANLERMRTGPFDDSLISIHTSGTTGTPMEFFFTPEDFRTRMAILDAYRAWFGVDHGMRRATFSGRVVKPDSRATGQFWQTNYPLRQRLYSSYHLSNDNLEAYLENLNQYRPAFIDGYPSALRVVARYVLSQGRPLGFRPLVAFTTAETLTAECRADIEAAFGCEVRDQYASSEGAPFIVECEEGRYHFLTYSGVLEVVDDDDRPAQRGRALFTAFHTSYMPLIRYDIGDSVELADPEESCPCGRTHPIVRQIIGREEDYLISPSRGKIGRLDPIFKKIPASIVRSQIVQRREGEVTVLYIPDKQTFKASHLDVVGKELGARLGEDVKIVFEEVQDIPLGARGKFKAVICELPG